MAPPPPPGPVCVICAVEVGGEAGGGFDAIWGCSHPEERIHARCARAWLRAGSADGVAGKCPLCRAPTSRHPVRVSVVLEQPGRDVDRRLRPRRPTASLRLVYYAEPGVGVPWRQVAESALEAAGLAAACPYELRMGGVAGPAFDPRRLVASGSSLLEVCLAVPLNAAH